MADKSAIEWTEATWNPIVGCSVVSPGCTNCYAMKMAGRLEAVSIAHEASHGGDPGPLSHYRDTTKVTRAGAVWTGKLALAPDRVLTAPLRWKRPRVIFVNSMGDLFHEDIPDEWIDRVFAVMALAPQHTFQVLTKRAERMRDWFSRARVRSPAARELVYSYMRHVAGYDADNAKLMRAAHKASATWPLPNVWLGVSAEDQARADERIPLLLDTPAAVRFVSAEPLLGPIDLTRIARESRDKDWTYIDNALTGFRAHKAGGSNGPKLDWVIVGGESGAGARPMHPDWARSLRDQCASFGVAFFFKQWGAWLPGEVFSHGNHGGFVRHQDGTENAHKGKPDRWWSGGAFGGVISTLVGKKAAGRLLDGVEHNGMPGVSP